MNEQTPRAERLHIAFYGRRNSGKSSLINALTGQQSAVVSATPGTTTDPVLKTMEIHGLGPCVLIDTPGFDDSVLIAVEQRVATLAPTCERHTMTVVHYGEEWTVTIERVVTPAADEA